MAENPIVSIITLTYNRNDMLEELGASLCKTQPSNIEWIVVDNGDDGNVSSMVKSLPFVTYIKHDNSGNFSSMNNAAAQRAASDTLIFLNNDMVALTDFSTRMSQILTKIPDVGAVGAVLMYPDKTLQHAGVIFQENACPANLGNRAIQLLDLDGGLVSPDNWKHPVVFSAVTGALLAVRRQEFLAIGGFHEEFDWAFEDVDLCLRIKRLLNKMVVVDPESRAIHKESQSGGDRKINKNLMLFSGRWRHLLRADYARFKA